MGFKWQDEGFAAVPVPSVATGQEKLYRAWGGDPNRKRGNSDRPGVCFSLDRASTRQQAELLYSVMEYKNPVRHLTQFSVPKGTPIWKGRVDPGDRRAALGSFSGNQVFIERAYLKGVQEVTTADLQDDLGPWFLHGGPSPRQDA